MRDFSWRYFTMTGNIDAYLLFKAHQSMDTEAEDADEEAEDEVVPMENL